MIGRWIEGHADHTPDAPALRFEGQVITYAALARDIARLCPASPGAGVIGAPSVAAQPAFAALANGILVNAADDDDTHKRALLHVGSVVVPAALATLNRHPVDPRNITRITNETDRIVTTHCSSKEVG